MTLASENWVSSDEGESWRQITSLPEGSMVNTWAIDPQDSETVWAGLADYNDDERVFVSEDGGGTWHNMSANLPAVPVNSLVIHQVEDQKYVYAGTDRVVYQFKVGESEWTPFGEDLSNVIVNELEIHRSTNVIYAATFGRGVWRADLSNGESDSIVTSVQVKDGAQLEVYPSPTRDVLNIDWPEPSNSLVASVTLYDTQGRICHRSNLKLGSSSISTTKLPQALSGLYYLEIVEKNHKHVARS